MDIVQYTFKLKDNDTNRQKDIESKIKKERNILTRICDTFKSKSFLAKLQSQKLAGKRRKNRKNDSDSPL